VGESGNTIVFGGGYNLLILEHFTIEQGGEKITSLKMPSTSVGVGDTNYVESE